MYSCGLRGLLIITEEEKIMRMKPKIQLTLCVLLFMVAIPLSAYGVDGQIKIAQMAGTTFPIFIQKAGSYVLTSDLVVTQPGTHAIEITVNDVTLDLNGHKIQGPQEGGKCGIYAENHYSITIKNGRIWGFDDYGIYLHSETSDPSYKGAGHRVEGIQALNNGSGGIYVTAGVITNCTANNNSLHGIRPHHSTVTNCTANNNGSNGISAIRSTVTNCTANNNGGNGIYAYHSTVTNFIANENSVDGIWAHDSTVVTNCTANNNGDDGIDAYRSTVTNCSANYNSDDGIYAQYSTVKGCNVRYNTGWGINTSSDYHNYIYRNGASANTLGPINCLSGNVCLDNAVW
jgi:parallel beta-helix repeat protein